MEVNEKTARLENQESLQDPLTTGAEPLEGSGFENELPEPNDEDAADA
ncbi:MAG: hypothetical protein IT357_10950 [Gemmatimonadaceae bacterium]|nr:hypothetical protein [Gemmatimonadaceae bacterium]